MPSGHGADREEPPALDREGMTGREPERAIQEPSVAALYFITMSGMSPILACENMWLGRPTHAKADIALFSSS